MGGKERRHEGKRPVGIWIRVSTENQAASDSPENHELRARGYATAKEWEVVELYRLEAVSGAIAHKHPEWQRMERDVRSGRISGLIFSKLARLSRDTRVLLRVRDFFRDHRAELVSLDEGIDTSCHNGRLNFTIRAGTSEWEREETSSRVRASVPLRAKQGKPLGGSAPYGYRWVDKKLELNEEEAAVRALMYELFTKCKRIKAVARQLNEQGLRTRKGASWYGSSVRKLLVDPISKGTRRTNYCFHDPKTKRIRLKPESEWVLVSVPAVVSEELWDEVNAVIDQRAEKITKRPGRRSRHLFSGLVRCSCGKKMYVPSRANHYRCKACSGTTSISTDDLEAIFLEKLRAWLTPETVASILRQSDHVRQERAALLESLQSQLAATTAQMDKLFELHLAGELATKGFGLRHSPLEERQEQLLAQIASTQGELDCHETELLSESQALEHAQSLLASLEDLDEELKRQTVETLVDGITVAEGEVLLRLNYFPFSTLGTQTRVRTLRGWLPVECRCRWCECGCARGRGSWGGRGSAQRPALEPLLDCDELDQELEVAVPRDLLLG